MQIIHKVVKHGIDSRALLKKGIDIVAETIKPTLGAKSYNVIVQDNEDSPPRSMNDGYYIADSLADDDVTVNAGIRLMRDICKRTNDKVGDGTTSTAVITQAIINSGEEAVKNGKHPVEVKKEIEDDFELCKRELNNLKKDIKGDDILNVATIASNNDKEIGQSIANIYNKLGNSAAIMVEKSAEDKIKEEIVEGIYFDTGYGEARAFINNPRKMTAEHEDVKVLCLDFGAGNIDWIMTFINKIMIKLSEEKRPSWDLKLLIICREFSFEGQVYPFLAHNTTLFDQKAVGEKGNPLGFGAVAIEAPHSYGNQSDIIEDIAIATGAKVVGDRTGLFLKDADINVLGSAKKIEVGRNKTIIIGGQGDKTELDIYLMKLKGQLKECKQEYREGLEKRINSLESGVGILKIGGTTDIERTERSIRVEDAILATKAAIESGVVIGGGVIYNQLAEKCKNDYLKIACKSIGKQIQLNAGVKEENLKENKGKIGFNALTNTWEDLEKAGVIEPVNVVKTVLENAVSFSTLFLTTCASSIAKSEYVSDK
jgi:chaperonin GroEL